MNYIKLFWKDGSSNSVPQCDVQYWLNQGWSLTDPAQAIKIIRPCEKDFRISCKFGDYIWYGNNKHKGIDYACPVGTPLRAAADGEWKVPAYDHKSFWDYNGGNYCKLRISPTIEIFYFHLSKLNWKSGYTKIKRGDIIGLSGNTGALCRGAHVHFEVRVNGIAVDPNKFLING